MSLAISGSITVACQEGTDVRDGFRLPSLAAPLCYPGNSIRSGCLRSRSCSSARTLPNQ
jgi:hypothetical protein